MNVLEATMARPAISRNAAAFELARRHLLDFTYIFNPSYEPNWHHRVLIAELEAMERGETDRLMVFMPPRHGKTELATKMFPTWFLGRGNGQSRQVISTSYNDELATDFGGRTRDIADSPYYRSIFRKVLSQSSHSKQRWHLDDGSMYVSTGIGGPITGRGADLAIIDDPVKNQEEAESPTRREAVWRWYQSTLYTRLEKRAKIIVILTRWNEDDLAGRLLKAQADGTGDKWRVIDFPAISEGIARSWGDTRLAGEELWQDKYDLAALDRIRANIGARYWSALYQQKPTVDAGNILKRAWWKRYAPEYLVDKKAKRVIQSWDTMFGDDELERMQKKTDKLLAFNAMTEWAEYDEGFYLTDMELNQETFPDLTRTVTAKFKARNPRAVLIEDKASGRSLIQSLMRSTHIPMIPVNPGAKNKVTRAHAEAPTIEGGRCFVPLGKMGDDFIEHCAAFPGGAAPCADVVDTTTQALHYFTKGGLWTNGG